jgi:hypothetical protein
VGDDIRRSTIDECIPDRQLLDMHDARKCLPFVNNV